MFSFSAGLDWIVRELGNMNEKEERQEIYDWEKG